MYIKHTYYAQSFCFTSDLKNDKLIYSPNDENQNYPFCKLKLLVEIFRTIQSKDKIVPKLFEPLKFSVLCPLPPFILVEFFNLYV